MNRTERCPLCGGTTSYLSQDIRPVFPEERLLLELLLGLEPNSLHDTSVWCENSRYYMEEKSRPIPARLFQQAHCETLIGQLQEHEKNNSYRHFNQFADRFVAANRNRLNYLKEETTQFIRSAAGIFPEENIVISFSGGKDSTVTADLVARALNNPSLVHIYGDTTLEFPQTTEYARRFREDHPLAKFSGANSPQFPHQIHSISSANSPEIHREFPTVPRPSSQQETRCFSKQEKYPLNVHTRL